jgi:hypothetical protein
VIYLVYIYYIHKYSIFLILDTRIKVMDYIKIIIIKLSIVNGSDQIRWIEVNKNYLYSI